MPAQRLAGTPCQTLQARLDVSLGRLLAGVSQQWLARTTAVAGVASGNRRVLMPRSFRRWRAMDCVRERRMTHPGSWRCVARRPLISSCCSRGSAPSILDLPPPVAGAGFEAGRCWSTFTRGGSPSRALAWLGLGGSCRRPFLVSRRALCVFRLTALCWSNKELGEKKKRKKKLRGIPVHNTALSRFTRCACPRLHMSFQQGLGRGKQQRHVMCYQQRVARAGPHNLPHGRKDGKLLKKISASRSDYYMTT